MEFSVFIVQDRAKTNQTLFDGLAGDVGLGDHLLNEGAAVASNVVGVEVYDRYANPKIIGKTGIAISGEMITGVTIKKEVTKREVFSGGGGLYTAEGAVFDEIKNTLDRTLVTTITVTGSLFAPSLLQNASTSEKMKNMAKVLAWASLPETYGVDNDDDAGEHSGDINHTGEKVQLKPSIQKNDYKNTTAKPARYNSYYFRRVMVTVYSTNDMQFRAILHDNVFVSSYEEKYTDKDGNGSFTLVMQTKTPSIYDVFIEGPTYSWNALTVTDEISSASSKIIDTGDRVIHTVDKQLGLDGKLSGVADKIADTSKLATDLPNAVLDSDSLTADNILDHVDDTTDNIKDTIEDIKNYDDPVQAAIDEATEYQTEYDKLTDAQKKILKDIPGFDKMSMEDQLKYIKKYTESK